MDDLAIDDLTVAYTRFPEPVHGPEAFKEMLAQTHRHFPDLTVAVETVVANGDQAVAYWRYRGPFQDGELFGVEASGQPVEALSMTGYQFRHGRVQREEGMVAPCGLMMQLGARPAAEDTS